MSVTVSPVTKTVTVAPVTKTVTVTPVVKRVTITPPASKTVTITPITKTVTITPTGIQGPQGPKGDAGDTDQILTMNAGEDITSFKVVRRGSSGLGYKADSATLGHSSSVIGIATQGVTTGGSFNFIARGILTDSSLSFVDGDIFVGADGVLTQTAPTSGFALRMGHAIGTTSMFVDIGLPMELV